tara:strand:- start:378 stop:1040 length:663 start_codon:yes stop_codon:yes gene_type:complete
MASTASFKGLVPVNLIGGRPYNGGAMREYKVASNNSAAMFTGDLIALSSAGLPAARTSTPTAIKIPSTSADATAGLVGVMTGCRYVDSNGVQQFAQYLPINSITGGATDVHVFVNDEPDQVYKIVGSAALGTFNSGTDGSGWPGAIGKNAALGNFSSGSTTTGNSGVNLIVGSNGGSLAATTTLAMRIVDVVRGTETDTYPEFLVKFNVGVHSYHNPLGI